MIEFQSKWISEESYVDYELNRLEYVCKITHIFAITLFTNKRRLTNAQGLMPL